MKYTKQLSVTILVTLSLLLTTFTWAYWTAGAGAPSAVNSDHTVNVGVGEETTTTIVANPIENKLQLVPVGRVKDSTKQTDTLELVFDVKWNSEKQAANGTSGILNVEHKLSDQSTIKNIDAFNISYTKTSAITADSANATKVIVTVKLNEPENKAAYDAVKSGQLLLDFTFAVQPQN